MRLIWVAIAATQLALLHLSAAQSWSPADRLQAQQCENKKKSFLWRVRRRGVQQPPAYLFGTIHVPYTLVWDNVPHIVKHHFRQASVVYFELDLTDPYTLTALGHCQFLPRGQRLDETIPPSLYVRLRNYFGYVKSAMPQWLASADFDADLADLDYQFELPAVNRSRSADQRTARSVRFSQARSDHANFVFDTMTQGWETKRPIWLMMLLQALNENEMRYREIPVLDVFLAQEALRRHQKTGAIERVDEQCSPLNRMNLSQVIFALNFTLSNLENLQHNVDGADEETMQSWQNPTAHLVRQYNCGNVRELMMSRQLSKQANNGEGDEELRRRLSQVDSYFEEEVLYKRNVKMAERVQRILEYQPQTNFFFAFGAAHFVGKRSVVELLREAGYIVEHVAADKVPETSHRKKRNLPVRNRTVTTRRLRRTTAMPNNIPVDTWSLSFVDPGDVLPQQRPSARPGRPAVLATRKPPRGQLKRKQRVNDELMDYHSYWNNVLQGNVVVSTKRPSASRRASVTSRRVTTPIARTAKLRTTTEAQSADFFELLDKVQRLQRKKMDESRVIDITAEQNEGGRRRTDERRARQSALRSVH